MTADEAFREAMLREPAATLEQEYGIQIPEGVTIKVHEETAQVIHIVVPGRAEGPGELPDDEISEMRPQGNPDKTNCCTCGSTSAQTMTSWQRGCGCN